MHGQECIEKSFLEEFFSGILVQISPKHPARIFKIWKESPKEFLVMSQPVIVKNFQGIQVEQ